MKHPAIILFTKFFIGFTPSYRHIMKRERFIPPIYDHVKCNSSKKTVEKNTRWFKCSVHFPCVCCIPTNRRKLSTMTWDSNALLCFYVLKYPKECWQRWQGSDSTGLVIDTLFRVIWVSNYEISNGAKLLAFHLHTCLI